MNSFLPTLLGYAGALSMVIGFAYYVFKEIEISWNLVEIIGYFILTGLFSMPFLSPISSELTKFTPGVLRLTSFLAVIVLPILIILSLLLHVPKGNNFELAGSMICGLTAAFSLYYAQLLDSDIIAFYGVVHAWAALQFIVAQFLKGEDLDGFSCITISSMVSLMFMGLPVLLLQSQPTIQYEKYCQYAIVLGMVAYIMTGSLRCIFQANLMDFVLIVSIIGFYYGINFNPSFKYVEIPLNFSTAIYVLSKLFHMWTRTNLPIALILTGAVLYGFSLFYQMRHDVRQVIDGPKTN